MACVYIPLVEVLNKWTNMYTLRRTNMSPEKYWLEDELHSFWSGLFFEVDIEKKIGSVASSTVVSTNHYMSLPLQ